MYFRNQTDHILLRLHQLEVEKEMWKRTGFVMHTLELLNAFLCAPNVIARGRESQRARFVIVSNLLSLPPQGPIRV